MNLHNVLPCLSTALLLFVPGCDRSTSPEPSSFSASQVAGCRGTLGKGVISDSCFTYQFHDALTIEFCAKANCCPDSNRFRIGHAIANDTISIMIADTAAQLCRCTCVYRIRAEFRHPVLSSYLVLVERQDYSSVAFPYAVKVHRD